MCIRDRLRWRRFGRNSRCEPARPAGIRCQRGAGCQRSDEPQGAVPNRRGSCGHQVISGADEVA
eukprot:5616466-Prymnesium_polylepis.1